MVFLYVMPSVRHTYAGKWQRLPHHACSTRIYQTIHALGSSTAHTEAALHHPGRHAHPQYAVCFHALQNLWQACDRARAVQVSHMREENDTLMDALVRAKIEAAESQGMLAHPACLACMGCAGPWEHDRVSPRCWLGYACAFWCAESAPGAPQGWRPSCASSLKYFSFMLPAHQTAAISPGCVATRGQHQKLRYCHVHEDHPQTVCSG